MHIALKAVKLISQAILVNFFQLQVVKTKEENILDSGAFDFRFDVRVSQHSSSISLVDLSSIIELFVSHSRVFSVKAQLNQIVEGLKTANILNLFKKNSKRMGELLIHNATSTRI